MRSNDNIKDEIKNMDFKATEKLKQKMLESVLNTQNTKQYSGQTQNVWRIIMNNKITKFAAAAVILITIGLLFTLMEKTTAPAWAELVQRVERSHDEYMKELLSAMEVKDVKKVSIRADTLSEFWQGINMLAEAKLDPTIGFQSKNSVEIIREKTFYGHFEQSDQQIFLAYANEFIDWLNKIEDEAWIYEIVHICKQMEEYAEEIREPGRHPEIDFSYAEHCLPGFITYCEWFEKLPWENPEQEMVPDMVLAAIERDLKIAHREIEAQELRDADRHGKRCMKQAQKNVQDLIKKINSSQMVDQWKLCNKLTQKIDELSGLMSYLAIASGDITQTNRIHDPEKIHQILTAEFGNKESFADYFIEQIDQSLDLCRQISDEFEFTPLL